MNIFKQPLRKIDYINILVLGFLLVFSLLLVGLDRSKDLPKSSELVSVRQTKGALEQPPASPSAEAIDRSICGWNVVCPDETPDGKGAMIRTITAYNVGDPNQTDSSPCHGATGENLCEALARGENVVATNELPLGSKVLINGITYVVKDRTNSRYQHRYDIAFPADQHQEALNWGVKNLEVKIIE